LKYLFSNFESKTYQLFFAASIFTGTHFWNFLENLDQCLPGNEAKEVLKKVRETAKTPHGRGRVFIRLSLNEGNFIIIHYYRVCPPSTKILL
jgi:hypothetical protein